MQKTDFFTLLLVNGGRELLKVYLKEYLSSLTLNQVNTLLLSPYMDLYIEAIRQREEAKTISEEENVEEIPETKTEEVEDVQEHDEEEILSSVPDIYFEELTCLHVFNLPKEDFASPDIRKLLDHSLRAFLNKGIFILGQLVEIGQSYNALSRSQKIQISKLGHELRDEGYEFLEEVVAIDKDYFALAFKPERWSVLQTCLSHCGVI